MPAENTNRPSRSFFLRSIPIVCFLSGFFMLLLYASNLSFTGLWADYLLPPVLGLCGLILTIFRLVKLRSLKDQSLALIGGAPPIIMGCLPLVLTMVMLIPPFTLAIIFMADEIFNETEIQRAVSPDGTQVVRVTFRGVGAYSGGNGRVSVNVFTHYFPILEREVYYNGSSLASEDESNVVTWLDNQTLLISENQVTVRADTFFLNPSVLIIFAPVYILTVLVGLAGIANFSYLHRQVMRPTASEYPT
ncbi:MAG TPA: hypothetical protein PKD23_09335 [Bellilinea sp.]|nr:hypothetical protein [Bellilinea sp.]